MKTKNSKRINIFIGILSLGISGFAFHFAKAWTEPATPPPASNVGAPVTTGGTPQVKTGSFGVGSSMSVLGGFAAGASDSINLYRSADNHLTIQTTLDGQPLGTYGGDNENRLLLQPLVGNVGIGTTSPSQKLDVNGNIAMQGKRAFNAYDSWLRINENNDFTSGIYAGSGILRTDGQLQVGGNGSAFRAQTDGNVYAAGTVYANGQALCQANGVNCQAAANSINWNTWQYGNYYQTDGNIYMGWAGNWLSSVLDSKLRLDTWQGSHYSGSDGTEYATNFRDANDGNYVVDPNGSSYMSTIYTNNWFRAQGNSGLYFQDYGGGWNMIDSTWIRSYGGKSIYQESGILRTDGILQVGLNGNRFLVDGSGNGSFAGTVYANGQALCQANGVNCQASAGDNLGDGVARGTLTMNGNVIANAGSVGIGTASPANKLEVIGGDARIGNMTQMSKMIVNKEVLTTGAAVDAYGTNYGVMASSGGVGVEGYGTTYGVYGMTNNGIGGYFTSTNGPALVTGTGNVGIGTASTGSSKLRVAGGSIGLDNGQLMQWGNSYQSYILGRDGVGTGFLDFGISGGGGYMHIDSNGTSILGNVAVSGTVKFNGGKKMCYLSCAWDGDAFSCARLRMDNDANVGAGPTVASSDLSGLLAVCYY